MHYRLFSATAGSVALSDSFDFDVLHLCQDAEFRNFFIVDDAAFRGLELVGSVEPVFTRTIELHNVVVDHTNLWDCNYHFRIRNACVDILYVKHGDRYYRSFKPVLQGLEYKSSSPPYCYKQILDIKQIWGNKELFKITRVGNSNQVELLVYIVDLKLTKEQMELDKVDPKELKWDLMINEIIGDG